MSSTMSTPTSTLYPPGGFGAPKHRRGHAQGDLGLPAAIEVFSADNHISLSDDIFYERFPDDLKDKAPRIWYEDGAYMVDQKGQSMVVGDFSAVLMQYDDLAGAATNNIEARIRELAEDGVDKELAFPNAVPPLFPGTDDDDNVIDYGSSPMNAVWDVIEDSGVPVTHHIGETPPKSTSTRSGTCSPNTSSPASTGIRSFGSAGSKAESPGCRRHCKTRSMSSRHSSTCSTTSWSTRSATTGTAT